jgi:ABC-type transport system involved in multi-copper enzyme maturation permease subunit
MKSLILLISKECRSFFKESRYWIPFFIPPIIFSVSVVLQTKLDQALLNRFAIFLGAMALSMGADRISLERERKMLELYAMLPLGRAKVFWAKSFAVMLVPMVLWLASIGIFSVMYGSYATVLALKASVWLFWTLFGLLIILWKLRSSKHASQLGIVFFLGSVFGQELAMQTNLPIGEIGAIVSLIALVVYSKKENWWLVKH